MPVLSWDDFRHILPFSDVAAVSGDRPIPSFKLSAFSRLHFLDRHAVKLAARLGQSATLVLDEEVTAWERTRIEAACVVSSSESSSLPYVPGCIVRWLDSEFPVETLEPLWRVYQTSRDREHRPPVGATLGGAWPHLRLGMVAGADLFNCGEYYAAHEDWESLWMRLDASAERNMIQGLIQLCGAHIHRLKGRVEPCATMWNKARLNLFMGSGLDWIDIRRLVAESDAVLSAPLSAPVDWPAIPLVNRHSNIPRKHR